ncbi:MAG: MBL fold metallo-hydrolase [Phycisphaerales bacterium]|nr:MBL fold metallo-hydrolase [Phycisphaerales bacterium]
MTTLAFAVLGSGSRGNCSVLRLGRRTFLVDAGLSIRQTRLRLDAIGLTLEDVEGLFLTHLDRDHFGSGWPGQLRRTGVPVHISPSHRQQAITAGVPSTCVRRLSDAPHQVADDVRVHRIDVAHDDSGCSAFVFEHDGARLGWATDLGHVPTELLSSFVGLDAIAFESNYDRDMQLASDRPGFLKERIMGGHGHLSNRESLDALVRIASASTLQHIALLHLSQQCNHPDRVLSLWRSHASELVDRLVITGQDTPSPMLQVQATRDHAATA